MPAAVRLQKILAEAGLASRRRAEVLIRQGRVSVNGRVVTELGTRADPERDHIKVDGRLLRRPSRKKVYWLLNKPRGVISTVSDPQGRVTVRDLIRCRERIYPVGRLDYNSEGLIILTNDGDLAKLISAAGSTFPKVYHVKVRSVPDPGDLDRLRAGLRLPDGTTFAGARIRVLRQGLHAWLEVTLTQGKNREIRKMFSAIGHPVAKLKRKRIGFLTD
ncbi:MAG: pseudouridine synthase, partial [Acidobacteriota bacterium]